MLKHARARTLNEIVARDVRSRAEAHEASYLRSPEVVEDWRRALLSMKLDIEGQHKREKARVARAELSYVEGTIDREDLLRIKKESREWRDSAGKVLAGVERRLSEAKGLITSYEAVP